MRKKWIETSRQAKETKGNNRISRTTRKSKSLLIGRLLLYVWLVQLRHVNRYCYVELWPEVSIFGKYYWCSTWMLLEQTFQTKKIFYWLFKQASQNMISCVNQWWGPNVHFGAEKYKFTSPWQPSKKSFFHLFVR